MIDLLIPHWKLIHLDRRRIEDRTSDHHFCENCEKKNKKSSHHTRTVQYTVKVGIFDYRKVLTSPIIIQQQQQLVPCCYAAGTGTGTTTSSRYQEVLCRPTTYLVLRLYPAGGSTPFLNSIVAMASSFL